MPKTQAQFVCGQCGHVSPRWLGRCPDCGEWGTLTEELVSRSRGAAGPPAAEPTCAPSPVSDVPTDLNHRLATGIGEMDRVLGGGLVDGSVTLIGGDPGIGKSTLLAQVAHRMIASAGAPTSVALYVSGEESPRQIRLRCERLGTISDRLLVVGETDVTAILQHIRATAPAVVVVDSIQTTFDPGVASAPGTVSQLRNVGAALVNYAKAGGPPVFLIGHVTKEGTLAGPRVLEHMVDTVLYFEGDRHHAYRAVRAVKNRFGPTDEVGLFEMRDDGLHEVANPSAALLAERTPGASGSAVTATMEGTRPLLVEIQALATRSFLSSPRRVVNGLDYNRAQMLLAVLEKRLGLRLGEHDVFLNVAGGIRLVEPAADLAVAMAVVSSYRDVPLDPTAVWIGEVGLGGEVRSVANTERRIREAARMDYQRAIIPSRPPPASAGTGVLDVVPVRTILDALPHSLEGQKGPERR